MELGQSSQVFMEQESAPVIQAPRRSSRIRHEIEICVSHDSTW